MPTPTRLADMYRLLGPRPTALARETARTHEPAHFAGRQGYDSAFLDTFEVALPQPTADVLPVPGSPDNRLDYTHFSVVMSRSRKMAMFVAVNIEGQSLVAVERSNDRWFYDGRIPQEAQLGEELYADNLLDRGHLVRRQDPNWGELAEQANEDTFHFTNCAPQMSAFNQKTWLSLEDFVLENARVAKSRISVITGPVFGEGDRQYRGVGIPQAYWKVIAFINDDGRPSATGYMIDQSSELGQLEIIFGRFRTYQRSIRSIEQLTGLDFGVLSGYDGFSNEEVATGTRIKAEIRSAADILV